MNDDYTNERPCIRGCMMTEPTETEPGKHMTARHGHLCDRCYYRLLHAIRIFPELIGNMRWLIKPSSEARTDGGSSAGKRFPPLPLRVQPLDDADNLFAKVVSWTTALAEDLHQPTPRVATWVNYRETMGVKPMSPLAAKELASKLSEWLTLRAEQIADLSSITDFHDDLCWGWEDAPGVFKMMGRYPVEPRPVKEAEKRECPVCGQNEVFVKWPDALDPEVAVMCDRCKWVAEPEKYGFYARLFAAG